jgi:hypothetical protein
MLAEWNKLAKYYEDSIYKRTNDLSVDLEMSLYIVRIYLNWQDGLRTKLKMASDNKDEDMVEKFKNYLALLEHAMNRMIRATHSMDEFGYI